jgi:hypothetical protein
MAMKLRIPFVGYISALIGLFGSLMLVGSFIGQARADYTRDLDVAARRPSLEHQFRISSAARLDAADRALAVAVAAHKDGTAPFEKVVEAARNGLDAELERPGMDNKARITAWQRYLMATEQAVDKARSAYETNKLPGNEIQYYSAKQEHERARMGLIKTRIAAQ